MIDIYGRERCELFAEYVIDNGATVRQTAAHFGISKSTVHKDLSTKLKYVNKAQYDLVKEILELNKSERHIRGGEATKRKYLISKEKQRKNREEYPALKNVDFTS
jgi:putative DeoR family transcriptional regulator (stage III sporulation protein D)